MIITPFAPMAAALVVGTLSGCATPPPATATPGAWLDRVEMPATASAASVADGTLCGAVAAFAQQTALAQQAGVERARLLALLQPGTEPGDLLRSIVRLAYSNPELAADADAFAGLVWRMCERRTGGVL